MPTIVELLDELDSLVKRARRSETTPESFVDAAQATRARVCELMGENPDTHFLNAESELTKAILDYEESPDLAGVSRIGNAMVSFRRLALSSQ